MRSAPRPCAPLGQTFVALFFEDHQARIETVSRVVTIRARSEAEARAVISKIADFLDIPCFWLLWSQDLSGREVAGIRDGWLEPAAVCIDEPWLQQEFQADFAPR